MFAEFGRTAFSAFLILRSNAAVVTTLISAAVAAAAADVQEGQVAAWVTHALRLNETEAAAGRFFSNMVRQSLKDNSCCCYYGALATPRCAAGRGWAAAARAMRSAATASQWWVTSQ